MGVFQRRIVSGLLGLTVLGLSASAGFAQPRGVRIERESIRVDIQGLLATTTVELIFANSDNSNAEASYGFELPEAASVHGLAMWVAGVRCPAVVYPRATARRIYRQIVSRRRDPAILEYLGGGRWYLRVFPIPANGTQKVEIVFSHVMGVRAGEVIYEHARVTESPRVSAVDFSARIRCPGGVSDVVAHTHRLGVQRGRGGEITVGFRRRAPGRLGPISLAFVPGTKPPPVVTSLGADGRASFLAEVSLPSVTGEKPAPRNVVFVLDSSSSMVGMRTRWLQSVVRRALGTLDPRDRFAIVAVREDVTRWREGKLTGADAESVAAAWKFVRGLKPSGGTDLAAGLRAAEACNTDTTQPLWIVVLTDGDDMVGAKGLPGATDVLRTRKSILPAKNVRMAWFDLASDSGAGEIFCAEGRWWNVDREVDLKWATKAFLTQLARPRIENLRVSITAGKDVSLRDVAHSAPTASGPLSFVGRYAKGGRVIVAVSAEVDGRPRRVESHVDLPAPAGSGSQAWAPDAMAKIVAHRRCDWLWQQLQRPQARLEVLERLIALSRAQRIVTRATAFLILETERDYISRGLEPAVTDLPVGGGLRGRSVGARTAAGPETVRRIAALRIAAAGLRDAGKYAEAADALARVKELDPWDFAASLSAATLREFVAIRRAADGGSWRRPVRKSACPGPWYEALVPIGVVSLIPAPDVGKPRGGQKPAPLPTKALYGKIDKRLAVKLPGIELDDVTLVAAITVLRKRTGVNIRAKWAALGLAGIDKTTAVNVQLKDVSFAKVLQVILDDVGGGSTRLGYVVEGNTLEISTKEDLSRRTVTLVYDVRDLLPSDRDARGLLPMHWHSGSAWRSGLREFAEDTGMFRGGGATGGLGGLLPRVWQVAAREPEADISVKTAGVDTGRSWPVVELDARPARPAPRPRARLGSGSGGGTGFFDDGEGGGRDSETVEGRPSAAAVTELLDLTRNTIDPTSWRTAGGEVGAVRELFGLLIVTQTLENHRALADLITKIRAMGPRVSAAVGAPDLSQEPEALFTARARLQPWVLRLLGRVKADKLSKFSSVVVRKVGKRVLARIGGIWFDTALTADSQVTLIRRGSPAARTLVSAWPGMKAALTLAQSVILAVGEKLVLSLDSVGISEADSPELKKLTAAAGE